ncbi:MAG: acyl-CoA thioesterase [Oceanospirillaceae bacterium]|jgi:acyl-CoA hydrolase|uniref:acyl-CoA thioesterase n=1 Tax=Marinobacterium litorale TaxID=404770 RepID=UPI000426A664|nr:acyl-CoA thioesterase [Marinobacterium litorale]MBT00372.1 acyl-CoA thioesterase [Oceanospirillaceae bacterium]
MSEHEYRRVKASQTTLKELMVPHYANFGGKVHGGVILSLMDKIAYTCAASHARSYCVTASIDSVDFLNPVEVGELLTLHASVNYVGRSSMEVGIKVISEDFHNGIVKPTNTSYFTMVAVNEETRKPMTVPGLVLEDDVEIKRFLEGMMRRRFKQHHREEMREARRALDIEKELHKLEGQNCQLERS